MREEKIDTGIYMIESAGTNTIFSLSDSQDNPIAVMSCQGMLVQ